VNFKKVVGWVLIIFLERIVELRPFQKPIPSKPVGHQKGIWLHAFKFKTKPKPMEKPFSKRDSCLG
jgi:hypothetical protein